MTSGRHIGNIMADQIVEVERREDKVNSVLSPLKYKFLRNLEKFS